MGQLLTFTKLYGGNKLMGLLVCQEPTGDSFCERFAAVDSEDVLTCIAAAQRSMTEHGCTHTETAPVRVAYFKSSYDVGED